MDLISLSPEAKLMQPHLLGYAKAVGLQLPRKRLRALNGAPSCARSANTRRVHVMQPSTNIHLRSLKQFAFAAPFSSLVLWRCVGRRRGLAARGSARQAPPRPPKEEPTPFPSEPIFPPAAFHLLELFYEDPDSEEMVDALEDFQDLHETDRHWGRFPEHVADCRSSAYNKGQLKILQGILKCIEQEKSEDLRLIGLNTLLSLMIGGCTLTRCPPTFVIEAGAVEILCKVADESEDATALEILLELARMAPDTMLPAIIEQGSAEACIKVLENSGADPMDQLTALNLLLSLTKRAPAPIAATGAYEVIKGVSNVALVPRRNKIMNFLRPLVRHEGENPPLTNIRTAGLKS